MSDLHRMDLDLYELRYDGADGLVIWLKVADKDIHLGLDELLYAEARMDEAQP